MTTRTRRGHDGATTERRRSDDRHKPGFGPEPGLMTCHKLGLDAEPGLMTVVALSSHRRVLVVMSSSCRRHAVVMPSVYSRRTVSTSSSCCRAMAVRPSAHCRRAVVSIVIWTRRDLSYPTSACLLNYAKLYIYHDKHHNMLMSHICMDTRLFWEGHPNDSRTYSQLKLQGFDPFDP